MKFLKSLFAKQPKPQIEKPTLKLRSSIIPENHGSMEHFNEAWTSIQQESFNTYLTNNR